MSFKPYFGQLLEAHTGVGQVPSFVLRFANEPCAFWFSGGRGRNAPRGNGPEIVGQLAVGIGHGNLDFFGWPGDGTVWTPQLADWWAVSTPGGDTITVQPVYGAPMWSGTPDTHWRYDVCRGFVGAVTAPPAEDPPIGGTGEPLRGVINATFDLYRPFNAAVPTLVAIPGSLYHDPHSARLVNAAAGTFWTHIVECADGIDIRDAVTRPALSNFLLWGDGDGIRFPTGVNTTRYVVVRVVHHTRPSGLVVKRVYLVRDTPLWPGP